jgi:hypothetical protein
VKVKCIKTDGRISMGSDVQFDHPVNGSGKDNSAIIIHVFT